MFQCCHTDLNYVKRVPFVHFSVVRRDIPQEPWFHRDWRLFSAWVLNSGAVGHLPGMIILPGLPSLFLCSFCSWRFINEGIKKVMARRQHVVVTHGLGLVRSQFGWSVHCKLLCLFHGALCHGPAGSSFACCSQRKAWSFSLHPCCYELS